MKRILGMVLVCGMFAWAGLMEECPGPKSWIVTQVKEYTFTGKTAATVTQSQAESGTDLMMIDPVADFMNYALLDSFSTSCDWVERSVHFRTHRASSGLSTWIDLDSTLWVNHIDDMMMNSSEDSWIWFLADTTHWENASVSANSYFMASDAQRWYVTAIRLDTLKEGDKTTIGASGLSRVSTDSTSAITNFLSSWASTEVNGHIYDYKLQLVGVTYGIRQTPTKNSLLASNAKSHLVPTGNGYRLSIESPQATIYNLQGQELFQVQAGESFVLPTKGVSILRFSNGQTLRLIHSAVK